MAWQEDWRLRVSTYEPLQDCERIGRYLLFVHSIPIHRNNSIKFILIHFQGNTISVSNSWRQNVVWFGTFLQLMGSQRRGRQLHWTSISCGLALIWNLTLWGLSLNARRWDFMYTHILTYTHTHAHKHTMDTHAHTRLCSNKRDNNFSVIFWRFYKKCYKTYDNTWKM